MSHSPYIGILLLRLHLCANYLSNRTIIHTAFVTTLSVSPISLKCNISMGANLVIDNFSLICSFRYFTSVSNFKALGQLLMEILHLTGLEDTECRLAANAVMLVLGECHISIATTSGGIYPQQRCMAMCSELTMLCNLEVIADGHRDSQTHRQPQYNSFATASRLN